MSASGSCSRRWQRLHQFLSHDSRSSCSWQLSQVGLWGGRSLLNVGQKKFPREGLEFSLRSVASPSGSVFPSAASHWGLPSSEEFACPSFVLSRSREMCVAVTTFTTACGRPHQTKQNDKIWRPRMLSSLSGLELFIRVKFFLLIEFVLFKRKF